MARSGVAIDPGLGAARGGEQPPPKLVLASEALKEDLAPIEPGRGAGRLAVAGVALSLALLGVAIRLGAGRGGLPSDASSVTFAAAGAALSLSALPFSYSIRAAAAAALGFVLIVLGIDDVGPLVVARSTSDLARLVALVALPGALLFRARYRAYRRARWVLVTALVVSLPFAIGRAETVLNSADPAVLRAGAALDIAIVLSGLFGFMGNYTTGGTSVWAALVIAILSGNVALRQLEPGAFEARRLLMLAEALSTACAATLVTVGVFHLLSARLARDARRRANLQ